MPAGSPPAQGGYLSTTAEAAKTAIDRLTFFSDAVVAIAMTLLALELPVPQADSAGALLDFLGDHYGEFLAFFISFFVIAQYWRGHHRLYRYVTDAPPRLVMLNILWLLTVILTPYATRNLYGGQDVSHSDFPWRFAFYAVVQACAAISFILAEREIQRQGLFAPRPRARCWSAVTPSTSRSSSPSSSPSRWPSSSTPGRSPSGASSRCGSPWPGSPAPAQRPHGERHMSGIDLHTHSTASDGTEPPAERRRARRRRAGLDVLALTDHDTVARVAGGRGRRAGAGGRPGARRRDLLLPPRAVSVHLLGYLVDPDHPGLADRDRARPRVAGRPAVDGWSSGWPRTASP